MRRRTLPWSDVRSGRRGDAELAQVAATSDVERVLLATRERGEQQRGENGNDRNDDEQFDECKRNERAWARGRGRWAVSFHTTD